MSRQENLREAKKYMCQRCHGEMEIIGGRMEGEDGEVISTLHCCGYCKPEIYYEMNFVSTVADVIDALDEDTLAKARLSGRPYFLCIGEST